MIYSLGATDIGCVRENNEDSYLLLEPAIYVLSDGMGGQAAGEVASSMVVNTVKSMLENNPTDRINSDCLIEALKKANDSIYRESQNNEAYRGMGATVTMLYVNEKLATAYYANVGDSRLYLMRDGEIFQLTRDDSYVYSLLQAGKITEQEAQKHPMKHMLLKAVGVNDKLEVEAKSLPIATGDIFLLTSDGLTNKVADDTIAEVLNNEGYQGIGTLINMAKNRGGEDNITVIAVKYDREGV